MRHGRGKSPFKARTAIVYLVAINADTAADSAIWKVRAGDPENHKDQRPAGAIRERLSDHGVWNGGGRMAPGWKY